MTHILIIQARFYKELSDKTLSDASLALQNENVTFENWNVPGVYEIPAALSFALPLEVFDGYVLLGCVIRGETLHYDYICRTTQHAIQKLITQNHLALGNGILTVENSEQAWERVTERRLGHVTVWTCLTMIALKQHAQTLITQNPSS